MTLQGWLNCISSSTLFSNDKPKPTQRLHPRHISSRPRQKPQPDTPPTSLLDFVSRTKDQQPQIPKEEECTQHQKVVDSHFGFVPLSRRFEFDIEACRILGRALKAGGLGEGETLPRVWTEPTKAQLRGIGRMGRIQGWRRCVRLVATPQIQMAEAMKIWEELEKFFWAPEQDRVALEKARGRWSFTEVPVELLLDLGMRKGLIERVRDKGNLEQDGQIVLERMGERRKPYGPVVARLPVIQEEQEDAHESEAKGAQKIVNSEGDVGGDVEGCGGRVGEAIAPETDIRSDEGMNGGLGGWSGGTAGGTSGGPNTRGKVQTVDGADVDKDKAPSLFSFFRHMRVRHFN